jgi:hypothetical protein
VIKLEDCLHSVKLSHISTFVAPTSGHRVISKVVGKLLPKDAAW